MNENTPISASTFLLNSFKYIRFIYEGQKKSEFPSVYVLKNIFYDEDIGKGIEKVVLEDVNNPDASPIFVDSKLFFDRFYKAE